MKRRIIIGCVIIVVIIAAVHIILSCEKTGSDRVWFLNSLSESSVGDMILVESNGRFGLIDASNRESDTILDANSNICFCPEKDKLSSSTVPYKNGRQQMQYLIDTLGVAHLDFVIATHSHSDHIGGIPEISEMSGSEGSPLIDSETFYFYKPYRSINEKNDKTWLSEVFYYQALESMKHCGALLIDVSGDRSERSIVYEKGLESDLYDDYMEFVFGDLKIRLYNLFSTPTDIDENVNSIVTVITKGDQRICCTGDLNVDKKVEQQVSAAISDDYPVVGDSTFCMSVVKASHHGYRQWSNSKTQADLLRPKYVIRTGSADAPAGSFACYKYYLEHEYGTVFFSVADAEFAVVAELLSDKVEISQITGYGSEAAFAIMPVYDDVPNDGWARWDNDYIISNAGPKDRSYYYFKDGVPLKDKWVELNGKTYYLKKSGIMAESEWCNGFWFNADGTQTYKYKAYWKKDSNGWQYGDDSGWYAKNTTIRIDDREYSFDVSGYWIQ